MKSKRSVTIPSIAKALAKRTVAGKSLEQAKQWAMHACPTGVASGSTTTPLSCTPRGVLMVKGWLRIRMPAPEH